MCLINLAEQLGVRSAILNLIFNVVKLVKFLLWVIQLNSFSAIMFIHAQFYFRLYNSNQPSHLPTVEWQKSPDPLQMPIAVNEMTNATPSPMLRIRLLKWVSYKYFLSLAITMDPDPEVNHPFFVEIVFNFIHFNWLV